MTKTVTSRCTICLQGIEENDVFHFICNDSLVYSKLLNIPLKVDLSIDENPIACNKCKLQIDEMHRLCIKNEDGTDVVKEIKEESVEIVESVIKIEDTQLVENNTTTIVKEEIYTTQVEEKFVSVNSDFEGFMYCYDCNYATNNKQNLIEHVFIHRFKRNSSLVFECYDCGYQTKNKAILQFHVMTHKNRELYKCSLCNFSSETLDCLNAHLKIHRSMKGSKESGEKIYGCDMCDFKTMYRGNLSRHKRSHVNSKQFKCNLCDYRSNHSHDLKVHLIRHTGERPFSCDKCDFKTYFNRHLTKHKRTHSQEKLFKCSLCYYQTYYWPRLKVHVYRHTGERPFACDKCDFNTYSKWELMKHKRMHSQERQYKCNLCNFSSNYSNHLKEHMGKHTGEQPFSCDKCRYKSYSKRNLRRHRINHTRKKLMKKCDLCEFSTSYMKTWEAHLKKHTSAST
ncbi:hypothetical protein FQR65_LT14231 [Abscondita terminalis]|nr:hypothetical protein FQR65_LT14231 [Abscondita terminalis]